ncbi:MAG: NAD(P)/FAD-dependent oxidoreductase [Methylomonas sp.]
MTTNTDILIIGGGISGLLTARELRLAGRDVTIIDKSRAGRESSWAGGGILLPIYPWRQPAPISDLVINSLEKYPALNQELLEATGIDPEWRDCGMLICKNPDFADAIAWCRQRGISYQSPPQQRLEGLHTDFQQPLWLPEIAQIRNPRLVKSLQAYLLKLGVTFLENAEISRIGSHNRRIIQVDTRQQNFAPEELIVSTGAWTANFLKEHLPEASLSLPITPIKGQMLLFDARPDTLPHMVLDGDQYLIPRRDGNILAGSTVEVVGFDKTTTDEARDKLYQFASELFPPLAQYPVSHHWAGLRPGTPQGIPYIGRHPEFDNLSINVGHFRNGLVMGPASAQLLADLILERPTSLDPTPYTPR